MKLCFLVNKKDNHSQRWIQYFIEKGHQIYIVPLREFPFKFLDILFNVFLVRRWIRKVKPDILHAHYAGVWGLLGALSGFHPFILTAYGSDVLIVPKNRLIKPFIKFALNKADIVTCNGEPLQEKIIQFGVDSEKIKLIYWGTDALKFKSEPPNIEILERLKIFNSPIIISLRSFETVYNLETLIKAIPLVLKEIPKAKFIIAGKGSQEDYLKKLVKSLNIIEFVKFVGWIPEDKVSEYLNLADVYVSTSLSDGDLSQCTQQAMTCEIPIITTNLKVNEKRINDGENGLLFPCEDFQSLAQKIIFLLRNKKIRVKLGGNGKKTIETVLNFHKEMKKAENLYQQINKKINK